MKQNPIKRFQNALKRAEKSRVPFPNALALATATPGGASSLRMMLLKGVDRRGFIFYTNLDSRKGRELRKNSQASITFFWPRLEEQIRVEGRVKLTSKSEADAYFTTRPRGSQIGAWASHQSKKLKNRAELLRTVKELEKKFKGRPIPRPPFWSGFILVPKRIEFWKAMPDRLHVRELFVRSGRSWKSKYLYP